MVRRLSNQLFLDVIRALMGQDVLYTQSEIEVTNGILMKVLPVSLLLGKVLLLGEWPLL